MVEFLFEIERLVGQLPERVEDGLPAVGSGVGGGLLSGSGIRWGGGGIGEIGELNPVIIGEDDLAFEFMHQLADIARP